MHMHLAKKLKSKWFEAENPMHYLDIQGEKYCAGGLCEIVLFSILTMKPSWQIHAIARYLVMCLFKFSGMGEAAPQCKRVFHLNLTSVYEKAEPLSWFIAPE